VGRTDGDERVRDAAVGAGGGRLKREKNVEKGEGAGGFEGAVLGLVEDCGLVEEEDIAT
jgi:hypothetical protein